MFFFDPMYLVFALPALLLMLYAQWKVQSTYGKYAQVPNTQSVSGSRTARWLLDEAGLPDVPVEETPGNLTDHYDPVRRVLRLSSRVYHSPSVAAMGIAAHEVGHAVQHKVGYAPMSVRSSLVPVANIGSSLGYVFFITGIFTHFTGMVWLGIMLFSAGALFALVTLPVELDASGRAKKMLRARGLSGESDDKGVGAVLSAAALTYVAALSQAVGTLLYYVWVAVGTRRGEDQTGRSATDRQAPFEGSAEDAEAKGGEEKEVIRVTQELLTFDKIAVPSEWGSRTFAMSEGLVAQWLATIGDHNPLYVDAAAAKAAGYANVLAPPATWPLYILDAAIKGMPGRPPGGVHARQELEFGVPVLVGDVLTTTLRIVDKYVKRERRYVVQETVTTNQRGEVVLRGRMTSIWAQ